MPLPPLPVVEDEAPNARGARTVHLIARLGGCVLLGVGLGVSLVVIAQAWSLYREPGNIERFAQAVEAGSRIDHTLSSTSVPPTDPAAAGDQPAPGPPPPEQGFRPSYFIAWGIAILLLLLIGRLALAAVRTGGELVLHDLPTKRVVRELLRAMRAG